MHNVQASSAAPFIRTMDSIFFEKQSGNLCAQHCLNALLQQSYFTAVDLAEIARRLDEKEMQVGAVSGGAASSHNLDDTGYFSVQVLSEALGVWSLQLVPLASARLKAIADEPHTGEHCGAFVCNMREHWFTIRRLGAQWFDLNSVNSGPKLVSDTYLRLYLAQLRNDGYTVFAVLGALPHCAADDVIAKNPVKPDASLNGEPRKQQVESFTGTGLTLSTGAPPPTVGAGDENAQLAEAIRLSLLENQNGPPTEQRNDVRAKRQAFLDRLG